ncbi:MAG: hypothetical protein AAF355_10655 [Myxococcota bacterium]
METAIDHLAQSAQAGGLLQVASILVLRQTKRIQCTRAHPQVNILRMPPSTRSPHTEAGDRAA